MYKSKFISQIILVLLISGQVFSQNSSEFIQFAVEASGSQALGPTQGANVMDLFRNTEVPSKFKQIKAPDGASIKGPHGTIVNIPPYCFETADGKRINGIVTVEMKEVFQKSDILLSNVSTSSGKRMLESGGTVFLDAKFLNEQVKFAADKKITIQFPDGCPTEGMELFMGKRDATGRMDWSLENEEVTKEPEKESIILNPKTMAFSDGIHTLDGYIYSKIATQTTCSGGDDVGVELTYDEFGIIRHLKATGFNPCYYKSILNILKPIKVDVEKGPINKTLKIEFPFEYAEEEWGDEEWGDDEDWSDDNGIEGDSDQSALGLEEEPYGHEDEELDFSDYNPDYETFRGDLIADREEAERVKIAEAKSDEITSNILEVSQLGWINCDRFPEILEKTDLIVKIEGGAEKQFARVFVVFEDIKSVINGYNLRQDVHQFTTLPKGQDVTIVAISYLDDKAYIGTKKTTLGDDQMVLAMEETSIGALKAEMTRFN